MKYLLLTISLFLGLFTKANLSDTAVIMRHLHAIVNTEKPRNINHPEILDQVAEYIYDEFDKFGDSTYYQEFNVSSRTYKNVITSFGPKGAERIIIGAHYDVCGNQPGADDNATGVVGLLELARLLYTELQYDIELDYRIDLVAYTLEEPPSFRTENMGSYVHANYLFTNNIPVKGMICLEMLGYFNDAKKSQDYPLKILKLIYGSRGDYITVVQKFGSGQLSRSFKRKMKRNKFIKTKSFKAPAGLTGIDFSDHLNYWKFGYSAVMITNTGFYRNKNYHEKSDRIETLDIERLKATIDQVFASLIEVSCEYY